MTDAEIARIAKEAARLIGEVTKKSANAVIIQSLNDALNAGYTVKEWQDKALERVNMLARNGAPVELGLFKSIVNTIYNAAQIVRQAIQTAYQYGRESRQKETAKETGNTWLEYTAINDSKTRKTHAAMDGFVAPITDKVWQSWYPPNGYNCRCSAIAISETEGLAKQGNVTVTDAPDAGFNHAPADWLETLKALLK